MWWWGGGEGKEAFLLVGLKQSPSDPNLSPTPFSAHGQQVEHCFKNCAMIVQLYRLLPVSNT